MKIFNNNHCSRLLLLSGFLLLIQSNGLDAATKYRHSFNTSGDSTTEEKDGITVTTSVAPLPDEDQKEQTVSPSTANANSSAKESSQKTEEAQEKLKSALEKQRIMLENFKPLIKPRSYDDLMQVSEWAPDLKLNRLPELHEQIVPGRAPNIRLIPYLLKSFAHPAYKAQLNGVTYYIAVNCDNALGFDDCSTIPHNQFKTRFVYVRFIQSNDPKFNLISGMHVGEPYSKVKHLFNEDAEIHGDGECIQTKKDAWLACFNAKKMVVNKQRLEMMPAADSELTRFIKISGRGY